MGLPLFVPPVESDVGRKSNKPATTSPPRSSIRRLPYTGGVSDRTSAQRTSRLLDYLERRRPLPRAVASALSSENVSTEMVTAAEYIRNGFMTQEDLSRSDMERDVRRVTLMESMDRRFGSDWRDRDWEHPQQDLSSDWWIVEPRLWGGRARLTRLGPGTGRLRSHRTSHAVSGTSGNREARRSASSRVSPLSLPWSAETLARHETTDDINGLGDRTRSVSPEGWDTLLTTLTPDPQPPSASSSFVSTAASQSAGASSNTSVSAQLRPAEPAPEPPCEPGHETSDGEDENDIRTGPTARGTPRITQPVSPYIGSFVVSTDDYNGQHRASEMANGRDYSILFREAAAVSTQPSHRSGSSPFGFLAPPTSGSLSRGHREGSATSGNNGASGDEELSGWQRIVRGLADREDIPDEWWAEAGLSRTLDRD